MGYLVLLLIFIATIILYKKNKTKECSDCEHCGKGCIK
jgi:hypothetical protein